MSSVQPSSSDRKSVAAAYGLPCAECGTYYPAQLPKCPTCSSIRRGPFTGNAGARSKSKPASAPLSPVPAPSVTSATERIYSRLAYGLPCAKCGCYYSGDLKECPTCRSTQRGAPTFGPRAVPVSVSPVSPVTPARGEALRGLGLPCVDCGAYYSGDLAACLHCGSVKRGPLAKTTQRLGPTLVVSEKSAATMPATSARPTTRAVKFGLPCAKCHSYFEAGRDTCPSCGHSERQKITAAPPAPQVAFPPPAAEIPPQAPAVPPLPLENAAALAADIADLIIQKLQAPEPAEPPAPPVAAEDVPPASQLSLPEVTAASEPPLAPVVAAEELTTEAFLPAEQHTEQAELPAPIADTPAPPVQEEEVSVMPAISALEIAPPVSEPLPEPPPAFDLATFAPIAPPQHFVVETEPSLLDDSDSLTAAISRAIDRAMRALRILPAFDEPASVSLSSAPASVRDTVAEHAPRTLADAPQVPFAEENQPTLTDAAGPPIETAPASIPPLPPTGQVAPAAHPEFELSETVPDPATVDAIEADATTLDLPPQEESLAPEATAVGPVVPLSEESPQAPLAPDALLEVQTTTVVPAPAIAEPAVELSSVASIEEPSSQPVSEETKPLAESAPLVIPMQEQSTPAENAPLLPFPSSTPLDCPTCHTTYDVALDFCRACAPATAALPLGDAEVLAAVPFVETPAPVIAVPAEPEITVVRCAVCDSPYSVLESACPACAQAAEKVVMISAPASDIPQAVATVQPVTVMPGPAPEDTMTLIDALDFFEELTRKLRA